MLEYAVCPCSGFPSLEMPSLALSGKGIDKATLSFLVTAAEAAQAELDKRKRKEEKEKELAKRIALQEEAAEAMQRARLLLEQAAKRRKRKKRRKRRTPRTSSRSLRGRARVLQVTFFFVLCSLRSSSGLRCPASWHQKDSCPRRTGKLDYLGDDVVFSTAPCIWKSLVRAFA